MAGAGEVVTLASVVVAAVVEVTVGAGVVGGRLGVELCWKLWAGLEKVEPSKLI